MHLSIQGVLSDPVTAVHIGFFLSLHVYRVSSGTGGLPREMELRL